MRRKWVHKQHVAQEIQKHWNYFCEAGINMQPRLEENCRQKQNNQIWHPWITQGTAWSLQSANAQASFPYQLLSHLLSPVEARDRFRVETWQQGGKHGCLQGYTTQVPLVYSDMWIRHAGVHAIVHGRVGWGRSGRALTCVSLAPTIQRVVVVAKILEGGHNSGSCVWRQLQAKGVEPTRTCLLGPGQSTVLRMVLEVWWTCDCHNDVVVEWTWEGRKATSWVLYGLNGLWDYSEGYVLGVVMTGINTIWEAECLQWTACPFNMLLIARSVASIFIRTWRSQIIALSKVL